MKTNNNIINCGVYNNSSQRDSCPYFAEVNLKCSSTERKYQIHFLSPDSLHANVICFLMGPGADDFIYLKD